MATRQVLAKLAASYERRTGQPVAIESVGGVDAARRVEDGEVFDIVVLAENAIERLALAGHVDSASRVAFARSGVAVAVATGEPHPDIGTEAALREAMLGARSIGYSTGPSGTHLLWLLERLGIAGSIAPRLVKAPPGVPVGALVARGEVALGFQQLSELIHVAGIDVLGALPGSLQSITTFTAAICTAARRREAARAWLSSLISREANGAKMENGMMPA
ncbi:ABC transporter substrate-binding protein [Paraburkholderia sp. Ac-20336]|uniref:substrate-binding domain-containing protein n=1 Tax=Burkholderiaceae TaxID=119060 RepID=UPI0014224C06|nr:MULTISPECIES: substrate-binding domain-containing protein [Burkholderiaceae]MBN3802748.1 ABC transporter substrate-binding protein [Paraburkholderia sp. Ac-20336]MBN3850003.1 ABC transporter substrate-binding protein [Paraburkholderia sp. Ac-20342]NIF52024.1 ABC transporter substrate-binding protein [Burkholderia sp. Ax-1724]